VSESARYLVHILATEDPLALEAAELASLRARVVAAQARTRVADPALIAEFAEAQRSYLEAKIQLERQRMEETLYAEPVEAELSSDTPWTEPRLAQAAPPGSRRLLAGSNSFWITVIVLLAFLACFLHSPYSYAQ
jgi:hypothetical protein